MLQHLIHIILLIECIIFICCYYNNINIEGIPLTSYYYIPSLWLVNHSKKECRFLTVHMFHYSFGLIKLKTLRNFMNDYKKEKCAICLSKHDLDDITFLKCDHAFHKNCINKWCKIKSSCPICRSEIRSR